MKVEIYDQVYHLKGDQDEAYMTELASFVDGKMRSIAEATHTVDSLRVAVLSALNIADELFELRAQRKEIDGPLRKRVERCVALVEKALESAAPRD